MRTKRLFSTWIVGGFSACLIAAVLVGGQAPTTNPVLFEPEYELALPGYDYAFPGDHGSHPGYKLEWWYFTGQLDTDDGRAYGYELTFFRIGLDRRSANPSAWRVDDLHVAHFALSDFDGETFSFWERLNRQGPDVAHAREGRLDVRNGSWAAIMEDNVIRLRAYADGALLELDLSSSRPPVIHGIDGISQKADGPGQASHYYSMTRLDTTGLLSFDGRAVIVTGQSWMDHEFGTNQLAPSQVGWDWFSLQLDNGEDVMLYQLRHEDGAIDPNSSGTIVSPEGTSTHLTMDEFSILSEREWDSPKSGAVYRLDWTIELPGTDSRLRIVPLLDDQELVTTRTTGIAYWEGAVRIEGTWRGQTISGRGYVELTGYGEEYRPAV